MSSSCRNWGRSVALSLAKPRHCRTAERRIEHARDVQQGDHGRVPADELDAVGLLEHVGGRVDRQTPRRPAASPTGAASLARPHSLGAVESSALWSRSAARSRSRTTNVSTKSERRRERPRRRPPSGPTPGPLVTTPSDKSTLAKRSRDSDALHLLGPTRGRVANVRQHLAQAEPGDGGDHRDRLGCRAQTRRCPGPRARLQAD